MFAALWAGPMRQNGSLEVAQECSLGKGRGEGQPWWWLTHHSAPAIPAEEATALLQQLDDVELIVVVADVGLVQGTVIVLVDLCGVSPEGSLAGHGLGVTPGNITGGSCFGTW